MLRLQDELGLTYLFITHDLATVEAIADQVVIMQRGKIVETGAQQQIFAAPKSDYTKRLLASVPQMDAGWLDGVRQRLAS